MQIARTISDLRAARQQMRGQVGVVPTMGALHAGHLALAQAAREENDYVITTIFVNPTQFSPDEDLDAYPRDLEGDLTKLEAAGVDLVFTPTPELMYPAGFQTYVNVEFITRLLEGVHRPTHFRGVTTVVTKLFNLTQPDIAYFGQKDAQQVAVIRRMVKDLNFPLKIAVCPTVREPDGLAMSSRNVYLSASERKAATILIRALETAADAYDEGIRDGETLEQIMRQVVMTEPLGEMDYVSVVDARTLERPHPNSPMLASLAVRFGRARLIDNRLLPAHLNTREGLDSTLGV
ncbi:MAG: pantoate--beta-alanine ligase [Phototrophicales bacterium]|nr:MAG: pantoate--beta-alanine ligase [Phototrophicales bacterium]RMG76712.1 MAG: pantoate--beta-alanine ligase [Chloroflexota bacterium]